MNNSKNIQEEEEHKQAVRKDSIVTQLVKEAVALEKRIEEEEHKQAVREASFVTQLSKESAEKDK